MNRDPRPGRARERRRRPRPSGRRCPPPGSRCCSGSRPARRSRSRSETSADLLIVACSARSGSSISLIERVTKLAPEQPIVVLQLDGADSNGFMQQVFAAGANDIVALPETPERIRHALQKAIARKRGATLSQGAVPASLDLRPRPQGRHGQDRHGSQPGGRARGAGPTRTCLVDLDLHFGDVGLGLRLTPERTIYDLAGAGGRSTPRRSATTSPTTSPGVRTLLAPTRPDHAGAVRPEFISEVLALLRSMSDFVVVDTPAGFSSEVITAVDSSTDICVVGMLDAFSLKDTRARARDARPDGLRPGLDPPDPQPRRHPRRHQQGRRRRDPRPGARRPRPQPAGHPAHITEGTPIVAGQPKSTAAKAFRTLASTVHDTTAGAEVENGSAPLPNRVGRLC